MAIGKSIRVYDLAREVKQDTKRVMEDLRREGADVSVPSNSVSFELAEKIRNKYFPKTEVAPKRGIKVIKAAKKTEQSIAEEAEFDPRVSNPPVSKPPLLRLMSRRPLRSRCLSLKKSARWLSQRLNASHVKSSKSLLPSRHGRRFAALLNRPPSRKLLLLWRKKKLS